MHPVNIYQYSYLITIIISQPSNHNYKMINEEFTIGFFMFCDYLVKYKDDYSKFKPQSNNGLLKHVGEAHIKCMTAAIVHTQPINLENFQSVLCEFFIFFNSNYLSKNCIHNPKKFISIIYIIKDLLAGKFKVIHKNNKPIDDEIIISLTCVLESLEKLNETPEINWQSKVAALEAQLNSFQSNPNPVIVLDKFDNLSENFEDCKRILSNELEKRLININHKDSFQLHINNKTSPPALFFDKFPLPFFPCNELYIDEFNDIIHDFQIKRMNLDTKYFELNIENCSKNIEKIRTKFSGIENIGSVIEAIEKDISKSLEERFLKSASKINTYSTRGYLVKQKSQFDTPASNKKVSSSSNYNTPFSKKRRLEFEDEYINTNNNNNDNIQYNNNNNQQRYSQYNNNNNRNKPFYSNNKSKNNYNNNNNRNTNNIQRSQNYNHSQHNGSTFIRNTNRNSNQNFEYRNNQQEER